MLRRLLGEQVELTMHTAPDLGNIKVDPSQLEQVIVNLAVNARDAMPDGGKLIIELGNVEFDAAYVSAHAVAVPGPYVLLAVSDTGVGMDAETRSCIFQPFFTTKEQGKGTGMGLATVYGIVKQSGGFIYVYSEPGQGTTFRIYLPRVAEERPAAGAETPAARPPSSGTETILLVEDEPAVRNFARRTLEERGYVVLEAASGAGALSIVASHAGPIALLVTDVVMPGLQGYQLAEQLVAGRPELRVLYLSGFTENSMIHHGVPDGGVAFLAKPFSTDALGEAVRRVLDGPAG
jgi:CheY-like chemotaxis protein